MTPSWAVKAWRGLESTLTEPQWKPWLLWYGRRLDGIEAAEDIELLFATLPVDPREKDPAEQNAALAAEIEQLRKPVTAKSLPAPTENVSAPFTFGWSAAHRVAITAGPLNVPVFPHAGSDRDHRERLDACRKTATRLATDLAAQKFNVRGAYRESLERMLEDLPTAPGEGNILMVDGEARTLRGLFEEDVECLPRELGERLNRVLEFVTALRPFYPGINLFYDDVKSCVLSKPLPKDAIERFVAVVREYSPEVFEKEVADTFGKVEQDFPPERPPSLPPPDGVLTARPDPLEAPDPAKAHDFGLASTVNGIYATFLKGKDLATAVKGWDEIAQKLGEHAGPVIEFLRHFLTGGG